MCSPETSTARECWLWGPTASEKEARSSIQIPPRQILLLGQAAVAPRSKPGTPLGGGVLSRTACFQGLPSDCSGEAGGKPGRKLLSSAPWAWPLGAFGSERLLWRKMVARLLLLSQGASQAGSTCQKGHTQHQQPLSPPARGKDLPPSSSPGAFIHSGWFHPAVLSPRLPRSEPPSLEHSHCCGVSPAAASSGSDPSVSRLRSGTLPPPPTAIGACSAGGGGGEGLFLATASVSLPGLLPPGSPAGELPGWD